MSRPKAKLSARIDSGLVEVKSKFDAEFRRFSLSRQKPLQFDDFYRLVEDLHCLQSVPFIVTYTDPDGDLLPINNDENFAVALSSAQPVLRLHLQQKGQSTLEVSGYGTAQRRRNKLSKFVPASMNDVRSPQVTISLPEDFRRVSAIIDVDVIPATQRRVRLMKSGVDANKPLGFYIRDGTSIRVTPNGVEKVPAIFISRLVPGGIAESTGLLAVNDEVMEVNGIEVAGKTLDQVTDMMVANSANMIITVKPANQNNNVQKRAAASAAAGRASSAATARTVPKMATTDSYRSAGSRDSSEVVVENDEEDEVREYVKDTPRVLSESGYHSRSAWAAQDSPQDVSRPEPGNSKNEISDRLNGIALQDIPTSGEDPSSKNPHEIPTRGSPPNAAEDSRTEEISVAKSSASRPLTTSEAKHTSNVRVVFTPIEDL